MSDSPAQSVIATLRLFRDITILRRGPEEVPVSWKWLVATVAAQPALGMLIGSILPELPPLPGIDDHEAAILAIELLVPLIFGWMMLQVAGRTERYLQMMTAVFGCHLVLQPIISLAYWAMRYFPEKTNLSLLGQAFYFALSVWSIVVIARIYRAATDWPVFFCVLLVVGQGLMAYLVVFAMFPDLTELLKQEQ